MEIASIWQMELCFVQAPEQTHLCMATAKQNRYLYTCLLHETSLHPRNWRALSCPEAIWLGDEATLVLGQRKMKWKISENAGARCGPCRSTAMHHLDCLGRRPPLTRWGMWWRQLCTCVQASQEGRLHCCLNHKDPKSQTCINLFRKAKHQQEPRGGCCGNVLCLILLDGIQSLR